MIDHIALNVSDIEKSKQFYKEVLATLGNEIKLDFGKSVSFGEKDITNGDPGGSFWLSEGEPRFFHIAFSAASKEEVNKFYEVALEAGGTDNGKPGDRPDYGAGYYAAFIIDPDGYNIEAVYHG
ncbi:VOC family protein [Enterococcus wangshanyuanii]|uniref:Glyoxalase n=1 Tax=Enterococcus wangshanyuanii TaxID=2005703 RepID=A0ABQ1P7G0_9ENTE|nr:VOC family protein [Enterococcus wangshanyuanii]GGC92344.1 glyoxalase [Enterococcus wangshanyuanii]